MTRIEKPIVNKFQATSQSAPKKGGLKQNVTLPLEKGSEKIEQSLDGLALNNSFLVKKKPKNDVKDDLAADVKISEFKNKAAVKFFKELNEKSPEKCAVLLNNKNVIEYCNCDHGLFCDKYQIIYSDKLEIFKNALDNIDPKDISLVINSLSEREENPGGISIINGIILCSNDKKAFLHAIHSPAVEEDVIYSSGYSKDLCRYVLINSKPDAVNAIDYNSLIKIEEGINDDFSYSSYTTDSDAFLKKPEQVEKLHNHLAQCVSKGDFLAYRGEKSSWMFDLVPLDKETANQVKSLVLSDPASKEDLVFPNNQQYSAFANQSIYDYVMQKEDLTLADAMVVAKYGNQDFADKITEKINNTSLSDLKFKSFTLSKNFALNWARKKNGSTNNNMLSVLLKTNIKKGNQVAYCARSKQYEFIVNNNPKTMTFNNAKFDKETNTFYINSEIEANEKM